MTACSLRLFTLVNQGKDTVEKLSESAGLSQRGARILMDAMTSLKLLEKEGPRYKVADEVEGFLVEGKREYLGDFFVAMNRIFYSPFLRFEEAVRTGKALWSVDESGRHVPISREEGRLLAVATHHLRAPAARALASRRSLRVRRHLLDVGGGSGAMALALAAANPDLKITILDRPGVCEAARQNIEKAGLSHRVTAKGSDFFTEPLPEEADVHLFSNIFHNFGDEQCQSLLKKSFDALTPGGELLVVDYVLEEDGVSPTFSSLFNLFALVVMPQGGTRPYSVFREWLEEVGFVKIRRRRLDGASVLIEAQKPA